MKATVPVPLSSLSSAASPAELVKLTEKLLEDIPSSKSASKVEPVPSFPPCQIWLTPTSGVPLKVGEEEKTKLPVPVSSVMALIKFADDGVPRKVATPVPRPETPVEIGSPVALVKVAALGVPRFGVVKTGFVVKATTPVPLSSLSSAASPAELVNEADRPKEEVATHCVPVPVVLRMKPLVPTELRLSLRVPLMTKLVVVALVVVRLRIVLEAVLTNPPLKVRSEVAVST